MSLFKKLSKNVNKFGKKAKDVQKFGKKISRNVKKGARGFHKETKKFSNQLEKGARKIDNTNLYVPVLNDAKGVVSGAMRNVGDASVLTSRAGMVGSDLVRGDLKRAKKRGTNLAIDGKALASQVGETLGRGAKVASQGARLVSGDASALFV